MRNALGLISLIVLTFMAGTITHQTFQLPRSVTVSEQIRLQDVIPEVIDSVVRVEGTLHGAGFFIFNNYIITNAHIVGDGTGAKIITHDGKETEALLVISDMSMDIAILSTTITGQPVTFAKDWVRGERIFTLGHPHGLTYTVTSGIISTVLREAPSKLNATKMVQFDADINPGNSGGALFNMKGELVGMPTLEYPGTNIGLAVNSNVIQAFFKMWQQLEAFNKTL